MRRISYLAVALIAAAPLALVLAQNPAQPQPVPGAQPRQPGVAAQPQGNLDPMLASCLIIDNQEEIAISEMAKDKAQDEKVKEFAQKMIEEHTQMLSKLDRFSPGLSRQVLRVDQTTTTERRTDINADPARPDAKRNDRDNQNPDPNRADAPKARDAANPDQPNPNPNAARNPNQPNPNQPPAAGQVQRTQQTTTTQIGLQGPNPQTMIALKRELAQECLKELSKEFNAKSGKEFDECFMTLQAMAHQKMVVQLTVFRRHASPALQPVLDEGLQTAQAHLKHAKDLVKSLDGDAKTASGEKKTKAE